MRNAGSEENNGQHYYSHSKICNIQCRFNANGDHFPFYYKDNTFQTKHVNFTETFVAINFLLLGNKPKYRF